MKHLPYIFACTVAGVAIVLTAYNGSLSWLLLCGFIVIVFPQWRTKMYRLAEKWLTRRGRDRCTPPDL